MQLCGRRAQYLTVQSAGRHQLHVINSVSEGKQQSTLDESATVDYHPYHLHSFPAPRAKHLSPPTAIFPVSAPTTLSEQLPMPSITEGISSRANEVYQIPELRQSILHLLEADDLARFMRVERKVVAAVARELYRETKFELYWSLLGRPSVS